MTTQASQYTYAERIHKALLYIEQHLAEDLSLDAIAEQACLSPFHFHRLFTGMVGQSVKAYQRRLRLDRAASWLLYSSRSIADIALEAGYESQEAFTRAFKAHFGTPPKRFRLHGSPELLGRGGSPRETLCAHPDYALDRFGLSITVRTIPDAAVLSVRHVGSYYDCGWAWETLCGWAGAQGLLTPQTRFFGVSHDDPAITQDNFIRYDACLTISGEVPPPPAPITPITIQGGDYACCTYTGPYDNLQAVYAAICGQGIPPLGREFRNAPSVECYLNTPEHTAPEDLQTEVRIPLVAR